MNALKSNDLEKNVAILGITANPVTKGHMDLAELVLERYDEVWLLPCNQHSHGKHTVSAFHRLQMCVIASKLNPKLKVCDYEIISEGISRTWETICGLKIKYPNIHFSWIIGGDNADTIHTWYKWEELIHAIPFIVVERKGYVLKGGWYDEPPHRVVRYKWKEAISSTLVRNMIFNGKSGVENYVPADVLTYINENKLYRGNS